MRIIHNNGRSFGVDDDMRIIEPPRGRENPQLEGVAERLRRQSQTWARQFMEKFPNKLPRYGRREIIHAMRDHCRFIDQGTIICGAKVKGGTAWCDEHHGRVYSRRTCVYL